MKNFGDWLTNRMSPDQNVTENQPAQIPVQQAEENPYSYQNFLSQKEAPPIDPSVEDVIASEDTEE